MGSVVGKVAQDATALVTVVYGVATVVSTGQGLCLKRFLLMVDTVARPAKVLSLPIADLGSHPPWWSSWSRTCRLKLSR